MTRATMRLIDCAQQRGPRACAGAPSLDTETFAQEIARLLTGRPRRLPAHALYDPLGSALFDAICELPWYPITRAETCLLARHGRAILEAAGHRARVVELGPGSGDKLATLLGQEDATRTVPRQVHLVDVSAAALGAAKARIREVPGIEVHTHVARYEAGLREVDGRRAEGDTLLVGFLGSNIGNFDPPDAALLLQRIRASMQVGDTMLIGADLVKDPERLRIAYDDPLGVTAAFNTNLLVRLNRELGADFALDHFAHDARWNGRERRMEMHLVSLASQRVHIPVADLTIDFQAGESIWTESSYKYEPEQFDAALRAAGFDPAAAWQDDEAGFLLTLTVAR
jgi:L-histidine N-alpha-methyltransferase